MPYKKEMFLLVVNGRRITPIQVMLSFTGVCKPPSTVATMLIEEKKGLKEWNYRMNLGQDTNHQKTINKSPCIQHNCTKIKIYSPKELNEERKQR